MQNSDSGTSIKLNPGDRVRIAHNPKHDREYDANEAPKRAPLHGLAGKIRERQAGHGLCFRVVVDDGRGAWFEADELSPIAAPLDVLDAAVQQALAAARREAQGWHSAALLARGEAEEARDALRVVQGEADALRGKLGAANAEVEEAVAVLHREREVRQATEERLAAVAQAWGTLRASLGQCGWPSPSVEAVDKALGGVVVAEHPLAALRRASFDNVRAVLVGLGATVEADNRAGSFTATLPAAVPIEALMWLQSTLAETLPGDVCLVVKGPAVAEQKAKVAGPWTFAPTSGIWFRRAGNVDAVRLFGVEWGKDAGWLLFPQQDGTVQRGPETGDAGKAAADRALLAAGWTLESEAKPEREDTWEATVEQRVAEIEARLGRLEEHAPRCAKPTPDGWSCILMPGHAHPNDHHSGRP